MKNRNGFVSNSSSCSFIIAVNRNDSNLFLGIIDNIEDCHRATTQEELDKIFNKTIEWTQVDGKNITISDLYHKQQIGQLSAINNKWLINVFEEYKKCLSQIKNGKVIYEGECRSASSSHIERMICAYGWQIINFPIELELEIIKDCDGSY